MVWFFTRGPEKLKAETRFDNTTREYVLTLEWPDGRSQTERFPDTAAFQRRLDTLKQQLDAERWNQEGAPMLLPDGWRRIREDGGGTVH
jgi:hypothetical protein